MPPFHCQKNREAVDRGGVGGRKRQLHQHTDRIAYLSGAAECSATQGHTPSVHSKPQNPQRKVFRWKVVGSAPGELLETSLGQGPLLTGRAYAWHRDGLRFNSDHLLKVLNWMVTGKPLVQ